MIHNGVNPTMYYMKSAKFLSRRMVDGDLMARDCLCCLKAPHLAKCVPFTPGFVNFLENHHPDLYRYIGGNGSYIFHLEDDIFAELFNHLGMGSVAIFGY